MPTRLALAALTALAALAAGPADAAPPVIPVTPPPPRPVAPPNPAVRPFTPPAGRPVAPQPFNPRGPVIIPVPVAVPADGGPGQAEPDRVLSVVSLRNESKRTVKYEFGFNGKYQEFELEPGAERFHASEPAKPDHAPKARLKFKDGDRERSFTVPAKEAAFANFEAGRLFRFVTDNDGVDFRGAK